MARLSTSSSPALTDRPGPIGRRLDALPVEARARALTHSSWAASPGDSYERYELLGDAVLDLALGAFLLERFPEAPEGEVSRIKNQLRSARFCAVVARLEHLGDRMADMQRGTNHEHGARRLALSHSVLADLTEAALGAIFLCEGWDAACAAAVEAFAPLTDHAVDPHVDAKTALQEIVQRQGRRVAYEPMTETGPPHARHFKVAALIDGDVVGEGEGPSRRTAEQNAARRALRRFEGGGA